MLPRQLVEFQQAFVFRFSRGASEGHPGEAPDKDRRGVGRRFGLGACGGLRQRSTDLHPVNDQVAVGVRLVIVVEEAESQGVFARFCRDDESE